QNGITEHIKIVCPQLQRLQSSKLPLEPTSAQEMLAESFMHWVSSCLDHLYMPKCIELWPCDWLICGNKQLNLIKRQVVSKVSLCVGSDFFISRISPGLRPKSYTSILNSSPETVSPRQNLH
ncbi:hypothetical protein MHYP_G00350120, partial [Metynnis hypsauchen]